MSSVVLSVSKSNFGAKFKINQISAFNLLYYSVTLVPQKHGDVVLRLHFTDALHYCTPNAM